MATRSTRVHDGWGSARLSDDAAGSVSSRRTLLTALLLALGYYAGVRAGFALTASYSAVALLWPANALVFAALLLSPRRTWPILIAAVLPVHVLAESSEQVPLSMVLYWFVSNVTEALIGAFAIRAYLQRTPRFDCFRDLVAFLVLGVLATVLSSFLDVAFVAKVGWRYTDYWNVWRTRLLSNVLATLTIVPLIVIWTQQGVSVLRRASWRQIAEAGVVALGLALTCAAVFLRELSNPEHVALLYVPLPFLVWAALRLGVAGVSFCVALVAAFAISGVLEERGPFTVGGLHADAMAMQLFLIIAAATLLLLSVSLAELRHARHVAVQRGQRLQLAFSAGQMGTWDWDVNTDQLKFSLAGEAGDARERACFIPVRRALNSIHAEDRARVADAIDRALEGANHIDVEFRWQASDHERWIVSKGRLDTQGERPHMLGVHIDVTDRKRQEVQVQRQREQLAHLSRVAMLGELSGALAHELNQPLTAIMANAQAAYRKVTAGNAEAGEVEEILADIIAADKRAGDVIRRLRALFLNGAQQRQPVDVNECIREVLALEHSDLVTRNVVVDTQLAPGLPAVQADRVQLQQVLLNLIINACDAMSQTAADERLLQIRSMRIDEQLIGIDVCDRGTGIADLMRIFESFYTTKSNGLGLGLGICQTIINAHRGRLWATNNAQRGATLHIALPVTARED